MNLIRIFSIACVGAFVALVAAGCGDNGAGVCDDSCKCEGCSDAALQRCKAAADAESTYASDLGCGGLYGDMVSCVRDRGVCVPGTHPQWTAGNACATEESKLSNCQGGGVKGPFG